MINKLPAGFGYLQDPRIIVYLAYHTHDNFLGRPVAGYKQPVCIATDRLLAGISRVQDDLDALGQGLVLKVFDAYRPQTAVNDFEKWSYDANDTKNKAKYYPNLTKRDLFAQGLLLVRSVHSRGSAVDLTIVKKDPHNSAKHVELDMGTIFDFFGDETQTDYPGISSTARSNRQLLRSAMEKHGFKNYAKEWWHYNVVQEQFPDTYFDFAIE
ncbi:MAG TPA: M15 family metallopeptidase [Gammaproteobacteria bacterium]|nr:M15 family metallopeptidase [Gammaproteobacteria bacterium]